MGEQPLAEPGSLMRGAGVEVQGVCVRESLPFRFHNWALKEGRNASGGEGRAGPSWPREQLLQRKEETWAGSGWKGEMTGEVPHLGSPGRFGTWVAVSFGRRSLAVVWRNWGQEAKQGGGRGERVADAAQGSVK